MQVLRAWYLSRIVPHARRFRAERSDSHGALDGPFKHDFLFSLSHHMPLQIVPDRAGSLGRRTTKLTTSSNENPNAITKLIDGGEVEIEKEKYFSVRLRFAFTILFV